MFVKNYPIGMLITCFVRRSNFTTSGISNIGKFRLSRNQLLGLPYQPGRYCSAATVAFLIIADPAVLLWLAGCAVVDAEALWFAELLLGDKGRQWVYAVAPRRSNRFNVGATTRSALLNSGLKVGRRNNEYV